MEVTLWEFGLGFRVWSQGHIINLQICEYCNGSSHHFLQSLPRGFWWGTRRQPKGWHQRNGYHLCAGLTSLLAVSSVSPGPELTPTPSCHFSLCGEVGCSGYFFCVSVGDFFCVGMLVPAAWWVPVQLNAILY